MAMMFEIAKGNSYITKDENLVVISLGKTGETIFKAIVIKSENKEVIGTTGWFDISDFKPCILNIYAP